jgi:hypothetical protein
MLSGGKPRNLLGIDVPINVPNPEVQRQLLNTKNNLPYDNTIVIIGPDVDDVQTALETLAMSAQDHELRIRDLDAFTDEISAAVEKERKRIDDLEKEVDKELEAISGALSGINDRLATLETSSAIYAKEVIYELDTAEVTGNPYLAPLSAGHVQEALDYLITRYDPFIRHSEVERLELTESISGWGLEQAGSFVYQTDKDRGLWEWDGFEWKKLGEVQEGGTIIKEASLLPTISGANAVGTWVWWDDANDMFITLEQMITETNPNSGAGGLDPYIDDAVITKMRNDSIGVIVERKLNPTFGIGGDPRTEYICDVLVHGAANVDYVVAGDTYYFDHDGSLTSTKPLAPRQPIKVGFSPNMGVLYVDIEYPRLQNDIFGGYF